MEKKTENIKKHHNISAAAEKAFGQGMSKEQEGMVNKHYQTVFRRTVSHLMSKFGLDRPTAEAHAVKGVEYALAGYVNGKFDAGFTVDDWVALSISQAGNQVKSAFRGRRLELLLDAPQESGAGEPDLRGESGCIVEASYLDWKNREYDSERAHNASTVYRRRDYLYQKCGISKRAGEIFSAYVLDNHSTEDVARRFNMAYEAVQTSACRTRKRLEKWGPAVVRELLEEAA